MPWENKEITWKNKRFVKDRVRAILHIPINFGQVIVRNIKRIEAVKALEDPYVLLSDENSLWGSDLYIAVTKDVPGAQMATISGTFLTKVFEGPYKDVGKWMKEMNAYVQSKGKAAKKIFAFYTTCPKCAKVYGRNYVVLFAQV